MKRLTAALLALALVLSLCMTYLPAAHADTVPTESAAASESAATEPAQEEEEGGIQLSLEFWIVWALAINGLTLLCMSRITRHTKEKYSY